MFPHTAHYEVITLLERVGHHLPFVNTVLSG
jgi:hypothetical protein